MKRFDKKLDSIIDNLEMGEEVLSIYCREILDITEEFTGKISTEDIINNIFKEFCIGK